MPQPTPPKMGPKTGYGRPGFTPPKPGPASQVEVERFDPVSLKPPAAPRAGSEADLLANAEPIDHRAPMSSMAPPPKPAETPPEPPEPMKEPLETLVPDSLIAKLEARFGIHPEEFHEAVLEAKGQKLSVAFRLPVYDDYIWSMAVIERKLLNMEDASLLQTDAQRNNMMTHLVACRATVKIEGEWLWQMLGREAEIRSVVPGWDGKTWDAIPDFIRGTMATALYELFRKRLHADLLFELEKAVKDAEMTARPKADDAPPDPSSAA